MQSAETSPLGKLGPTSIAANRDLPGGSYTSISIYKSVELVSVDCSWADWGAPATSRTIEIYSVDNAATVATFPASIKGANNTIPIGQTLSPGNYRLIIRGGSVGTNAVWSGSPSLYSLGNSVDITGYSPANTYGAFANLEFVKSEACSPVPVKLVGENCCTQLAATVTVKSGTATTCTGDALVLEATPDASTKWSC